MEAAAPTEEPTETFGAELRRSLPHLLWPFRLRPLGVLLAVAVLALTTVIPVLGPILGVALAVVIAHTGFRALDHTGREALSDADPLNLRPNADAILHAVVFLMVFSVWGGIAFVIGAFGGVIGGVAGSLLPAGVLPAVILRIGREHGLMPAIRGGLNPAGLVRDMRLIGRPYLVAAGLPLLLALVTAGALYGLAGRAPLEALVLSGSLLVGYSALGAFRLAACLAVRFREELGYTKKRPRPVAPAPKEAPEPTTDERVKALVKAEQFEEAAELLRAEVTEQPASLHWWERYYRMLRHLNQDESILAASRGFLTVLLYSGEEVRAMEVIHDALNRDPNFCPAKPEQIFQMARIARREDRPRLALRIMNGFAKRCPDHADAPKVLLLAARIAGEDFRRTQEAAKLLDSLLRNYPDHPLASEARRLREA